MALLPTAPGARPPSLDTSELSSLSVVLALAVCLPSPRLLVGGEGGGQGVYGGVELFPCGRDRLRAGRVGVGGGGRLRVTVDEVDHGPSGGADGHAAGDQVRLTAFT